MSTDSRDLKMDEVKNAIIGISVAGYLAWAMERTPAVYRHNQDMIIESSCALAWQYPQTRHSWVWDILKNQFVVNLHK